MRKIFGTDGVRDLANHGFMRPDFLLRLAIAAGQEFIRGPHRHLVVIGKDTRLSGYMVEAALTAGLVSIGMDVMLVGPLPTPSISLLTRSLRADLGIMISASHNPYQDNGIKLFGPNGYKLADALEKKIEGNLHKDLTALATPENVGKARRLDDAQGRYIEYVKNTFPRRLTLEGWKIVIDCAHGAAYKVAPKILWELGAEVITIGDEPTGININEECGVLAPLALQATVLQYKADIGIALDGDGDRLLLVDEQGELINGDSILAAIATFWQQEGLLEGKGIISTTMANLSLEEYLRRLELRLIRTQVGDRYVWASMIEQGINVGGEQSGHIILSNFAPTGDGMISALQVLAYLKKIKKKASYLRGLFKPYPQRIHNLRGYDASILSSSSVQQAMTRIESTLGENGRLVVRPSGTEPLIRIMVESKDPLQLDPVIQHICQAIEHADLKGEEENGKIKLP